MPRPKAKGSLAANQLQLAIALSTSLEESKNRELSKLAEELPADVIEKGAIPDNIKQMQKEFLERLKPVAAAPSKRKRKTTKIPVPVLYTRSSEERIRIITEKVALTLIKEGSNEFYYEPRVVCRKLHLNFKNEACLWNRSFLLPAIEERHFYYVESLSAFISQRSKSVDVLRRKQISLPGRFLSPKKREPDGETLSNMSQSKNAHEINNTQNWCNATLLDDRDVSNQEAQHQFQNDWLSMLNCPQFSDLTVYTKNGKDIAVHKLVLYARCPTILEDLDTLDSLRWEDIDYYDAFAFLKFIYSGLLEAYLQYTKNSGVVFLARKYKVLDLLNHIFATDADLFETGAMISEENLVSTTSCTQGNAFTCMKPDQRTEVLHPISTSSTDSSPLEKTPENKKMPERILPTYSPTVASSILISSAESSPLEETPERKNMVVKSLTLESPKMSDNSKRKLQDENTPRKLIGKKLCVKVLDTEKNISPVKYTFQKTSLSKTSNFHPTSPLGECREIPDEEQVPSPFNFDISLASPIRDPSVNSDSPFTDSHHLDTSQLTDDEPEILDKSFGDNSVLETAKKSGKHSPLQLAGNQPDILYESLGADPLIQIADASPLKAAKLRSSAHAEDYKIFLEDSFCFDVRTPRQVRPEDAASLRTPLTDIKTSSPITPMPDFQAMGSEQLQAELCKFGLKRSLSINKSIKMLTHIYEKQHPLVEVVVKDGRELYVPIGDKTPRSADFQSTNPLPLAVPLKHDEPEPSDDDKSLSDSSSDEGEVIEESMFADEDNAGYEGVTDMKANIHAWISSNRDLYEKVLRYEPIWLESVHSELKEYTHQNIKLSHLMNILDEEGVTYRFAQKTVEGGRRKKEKKPKEINNA